VMLSIENVLKNRQRFRNTSQFNDDTFQKAIDSVSFTGHARYNQESFALFWKQTTQCERIIFRHFIGAFELQCIRSKTVLKAKLPMVSCLGLLPGLHSKNNRCEGVDQNGATKRTVKPIFKNYKAKWTNILWYSLTVFLLSYPWSNNRTNTNVHGK
jgi:hypothetical protein